MMMVMMMQNMAENWKPFPLITPMITGQSAIAHVACDHIVIYYTRCCDQIELVWLFQMIRVWSKNQCMYSVKDIIHQAHCSVLVFYTKYNAYNGKMRRRMAETIYKPNWIYIALEVFPIGLCLIFLLLLYFAVFCCHSVVILLSFFVLIFGIFWATLSFHNTSLASWERRLDNGGPPSSQAETSTPVSMYFIFFIL